MALVEEILRDYTIGTPLLSKGDDIVQTATSKARET